MIITIANNKGGVGKSTSCINIAVALAQMGHSTLLIDCDLQGHATKGVGINPWDLDSTLLDVLTNVCEIENAIYESYGVDIIGNNLDQYDKVVRLNAGMGGIESKLRNALNRIIDEYEYILIDTPPQIDTMLRIGISTADCVIVPLQLEPFAIMGLDHLVQQIRNTDKRVLGILFTMVSKRFRLTDRMCEAVSKMFDARIFNAMIPRSVRVAELQESGTPIVVMKHRVGQAYIEVAQEVVRYGKEKNE